MKKILLSTLVLFVLISWVPATEGDDTWDDFIPANVKNTTLLIEKFEYHNPTKYTPALLTGGSYEWPKDTTPEEAYKPDTTKYVPDKKVDIFEHPLVKATNKNLEENNKKLENLIKKYKYKHELINREELTQKNGKFANTQEYRYVLRRTPYLKVGEGPNTGTNFYYTYLYYFYDREEKKAFRSIDIFNPFHLSTVKKIVARLNQIQ